jgi:hypothetical protein
MKKTDGHISSGYIAAFKKQKQTEFFSAVEEKIIGG